MLKYVTFHLKCIVILTDHAPLFALCSWLTDNGGGDNPNSAIANQGADLLIVNITDSRNMVKNLGLSIPIGNSDAGSYFNNKILEAVDYGVRLCAAWIASLLLMLVK